MNEIEAEFDPKNIPLTLIEVEFTLPWFGTDKIICHDILYGEFLSIVYFTKNRFWRVPTEFIKSQKEIINPLMP